MASILKITTVFNAVAFSGMTHVHNLKSIYGYGLTFANPKKKKFKTLVATLTIQRAATAIKLQKAHYAIMLLKGCHTGTLK